MHASCIQQVNIPELNLGLRRLLSSKLCTLVRQDLSNLICYVSHRTGHVSLAVAQGDEWLGELDTDRESEEEG